MNYSLIQSHKLWPTLAGSFAGMYPVVDCSSRSIRGNNEQGTAAEDNEGLNSM